MLILVGCMQVDDAGVAPGRLQDRQLVDHLCPAVAASPPLPHELGRKLFTCRLLNAPLHHCKLSPEEQQRCSRVRHGLAV